MKRALIASISALMAFGATTAHAEREHYVVDEGHSFIQFKISHLGFSWTLGRFNDMEGEFYYDPENPENSEISVVVQTRSIDSNHSERDRHLRDEDFLHASAYPEATFETTGFSYNGDGQGVLIGDFTLRGHTREIEIDVEQVGAGEDPWGDYRRGFAGEVTLTLEDFGIDYDLGEEARTVDLFLSVEGVRQ